MGEIRENFKTGSFAESLLKEMNEGLYSLNSDLQVMEDTISRLSNATDQYVQSKIEAIDKYAKITVEGIESDVKVIINNAIKEAIEECFSSLNKECEKSSLKIKENFNISSYKNKKKRKILSFVFVFLTALLFSSLFFGYKMGGLINSINMKNQISFIKNIPQDKICEMKKLL